MSFLQLIEVHDGLNEMFLQHQEMLLRFELDRAASRLNEYEIELKAHMKVEEELLMPVYRRAGRIEGGPPEFFTGEHGRMLSLLGKIQVAIGDLKPGQSDLPRRIIRIFDEEAVFKSLCEHHEQRERNIFFPALDRVTEEDERRELVARSLAANPAIRGNFESLTDAGAK